MTEKKIIAVVGATGSQGGGLVQAIPPRPIREALRGARLGLEFMSTESAARMYGVLLDQGRRFATCLIAI